MDTKQYTAVAIGCVILLIFTVSVVTPILNNVTYSQTEENTPTGYATKVIPSGTYTWTNNGFMVNDNAEIPVNTNDWVLLSDSLAIVRYWNSFRIIDYGQETQTTTSSLTIDSAAGKWSVTSNDTTTTGNIGNNAIVRSATGELGTYLSTDFIINKADYAQIWRLAYQINIGGTEYTARSVVTGTIDNLRVQGLNLVASSDTLIFIDDATATINPASIEEVSFKAYKVASNMGVIIKYSYGGSDYTQTFASASSVAAPLTYTVVTGSAIESMIDIVPLLMIAGIITMLIGYFIARRS